MNLSGRKPYQKGLKPAKVKALRDEPRDESCKLRLPGCRYDAQYTVGGHFRATWLSGAAQKPDDLFLMDTCDNCHALQEAFAGDPSAPIGYDDILRALTLTQQSRRASGLIILRGEITK